jgi:multicomponent Na+:H+ antiporter subunit D
VLIPALSLIGLPLTSGAFAKEALKSATTSWPLFSTFLVFSAVGTSFLMGRFIQLMRQPSISKTSNSSPRWGLILPTALCTLMCVGYVYFTPAFEFKIQQRVFSTMSWAAIWPGLIGLLVFAISSRLRAGILAPPAGDILMVYQKVARLCQKIAQELSHFIARMTNDSSRYFQQTLDRSQSLLNNSSKHLVVETPGTVMVIVLVLLFYTFIS